MQGSPAFLAPGTGFMEDSFSTDGGRMVQVIMQAMGIDGERQMKLRLLAPCSLPAVRPSS